MNISLIKVRSFGIDYSCIVTSHSNAEDYSTYIFPKYENTKRAVCMSIAKMTDCVFAIFFAVFAYLS